MPRDTSRLNNEIRIFIVTRLAMGDKFQEIANAVKEEFGLAIERQVVWHYSPTNPKVPQKWRELYEVTKASFQAAVAEIPVAQQAYRLRRLDEGVRYAVQRKNLPLMRDLLETAAKEVGGAFTNQRQVSGRVAIDFATLTEDQLARIASGEDPVNVLIGAPGTR